MYRAALVSAHFKDCVSDVNSHPSMSSAPSFLMTRVDLKNKRTKLVKLQTSCSGRFHKTGLYCRWDLKKKDFSVQHILLTHPFLHLCSESPVHPRFLRFLQVDETEFPALCRSTERRKCNQRWVFAFKIQTFIQHGVWLCVLTSVRL